MRLDAADLNGTSLAVDDATWGQRGILKRSSLRDQPYEYHLLPGCTFGPALCRCIGLSRLECAVQVHSWTIESSTQACFEVGLITSVCARANAETSGGSSSL